MTAPRESENIVTIGCPASGKTQSAARSSVESEGAEVVFDPHKQSLAQTILTHDESDNLLLAKLSDLFHTIGFTLLLGFALLAAPTANRLLQHMENQRRAEVFCDILLRRRASDGMAQTPLMEEWIFAILQLFLFQAQPKDISLLPYGFLPGTPEFDQLVRGCTLPDVRHKFRQLEKLNFRALRAEVGSAARLINSVFRSPAFAAWSRGGFNLGAFLDKCGKLVVERGDDIGDDTMRTIMGAIILLVIEYAKSRRGYLPTVFIRIDEATNARLVGRPELCGAAETNKHGLYWHFIVQKLDFPGDPDAILQICTRHEWLRSPHYDLARKAATDVAAGVPREEGVSRSEVIATLTNEIMNLKPGWRWVRDRYGSRKEYVEMLGADDSDWPNWPGLREDKLNVKLAEIYSRPEYGVPCVKNDSTSPADTPSSPSNSPDTLSPAERWKRKRKKPADGSSGSGDGGKSPS